jgi:hypothetical protein
VLFVYPDNEESTKLMESRFDIDQLECAFGGKNPVTFDKEKYAIAMKEDDIKFAPFLQSLSSLNLNTGAQAVSCSNGAE